MIIFFNSILNEFLKLKRTFASWLCLISALFIPLLYFSYYLLEYQKVLPGEGVNPWEKFIGINLTAAVPILLPLFIVLITSLINQTEHRSGGYKHIFALAIPKWSIYFGKLTTVVLLVMITYFLFFLTVLGSGFLLGMIHSELNFLSFDFPSNGFLKMLFRSFIAVLGILGIQFWLSFKIKNFVVPFGLGIFFIITGLTVYNAEEAVLFPYVYNLLNLYSANPKALDWFTEYSLYSFLFFVIAAIFGYFHIKNSDIK